MLWCLLRCLFFGRAMRRAWWRRRRAYWY